MEVMEAGKRWKRRIGSGGAVFTGEVLNPPHLEGWMRDMEDGISVDLSNPLCPKFMIDDKEREHLCKPFVKSMFVKLLGGNVLKLDVHTTSRGRNKFARVCVELDLTKPLVPHYMVDGVLKHVEYKSLHALCLNYGLFGHFKESYVHGKKGPSEVEKVVLEGSDRIEEGEERGQGDISVGKGAAMEENNGRQFIKQRDRGLKKPVSIVKENGPRTEAVIVPKGSQ
ncbi:hypothetical protein K1719_003327 [Acacia pycnantha]|nr:hypothetical protein K1719_003327 [Acacia pycnantha]